MSGAEKNGFEKLKDKFLSTRFGMTVAVVVVVTVAAAGFLKAVIEIKSMAEADPPPIPEKEIVKPAPAKNKTLNVESTSQTDSMCRFNYFAGRLTTPGHPKPWFVTWDLRLKTSSGRNNTPTGFINGQIKYSCLNNRYKIEHYDTTNGQNSLCVLIASKSGGATGTCQPDGGEQSYVSGTLTQR
ncbi:MAG: hypothetical protein ABJN40_05955 [Sneathiella sp.]